MGVLRADDFHAVDGMRVSRSRKGRSLNGGPFLAYTVIPEHNLAGVGAAQNQIGVESRESGRHDLRLALENVLGRRLLKPRVPDETHSVRIMSGLEIFVVTGEQQLGKRR